MANAAQSTDEAENTEPKKKARKKAPRKRRRPQVLAEDSGVGFSRQSTPPIEVTPEVLSAELENWSSPGLDLEPTPEPTPAPKRRARKPGTKSDAKTALEKLPAKRKPAKSPARKRTPRTPPPSLTNKLSRELAGLACIAIGVMLSLALISYDAHDPGFGVASSGGVKNWVGVVGAYLADGLTLMLGLVAFVVPLFFFGLAIGMFRTVPVRVGGREVIGGATLLVGLVMLLDVALGAASFLAYPAGGLVGAVIGGHLSRWVAPLGTGVVAVFLSCLGAMLLRKKTLSEQVHEARDFASKLLGHALDSVEVWKEKRRLLDDEHERLLEAVRAREEASAGETEEQIEARKARIKEKAEEKARAALEVKIKVRDSAKPEPTKASEPAWVGTKLELPAGMNDTIEEPVVDGMRLRIASAKPTLVDEGPREPDEVQPAVAAKKAKAKSPAEDEGAGLVIVEREDGDHQKQIEQAERQQPVKKAEFQLPPLNLLDYDAPERTTVDPTELQAMADKLVRKFNDFGIDGRVREVRPGPVCTTYEFVPAPGIKVSRIAALADDIAMAMEAFTVRIVAPIPGKGAVGIEIPNERREMVFLKEIVADPKFMQAKSKLEMALGKDIEGNPHTADLAGMPHCLISGTTGSGKSVSVNGMICSLLYRNTPDEVKFLMIDPKMLELSIYEGIPHLLLPPITDSKKAGNALRWAVDEMERRYQWMSDMGVRDLDGYNKRIREAVDGVDKEGKRLPKREGGEPHKPEPYLVVVIDEYADLLAVAGKEVEGYVMRLAQKARASGIHVMLATQRPSVDVITGVIKANFPVRMGFRLASVHDSKTIVNRPGAEKLLGKGDMLLMPAGTANLTRVHGAFISEKELHRVVDFLKQQGKPDYDMSILDTPSEGDGDFGDEEHDAKWDEAIAVVARARRCSTSWLQRQLGIGYNRAAKIVEMMEREGLIGPQLSAKGDRDIHIPNPE